MAWHAVPHEGHTAFVGDQLARLSMDLATGSAGVLLALSAGGILGWGHPLVIGGALGFVAFAPLFFWLEMHIPEPLLDLSLFRNRIFSIGNFTQGINGTARMGWPTNPCSAVPAPNSWNRATPGITTVAPSFSPPDCWPAGVTACRSTHRLVEPRSMS